MADDQACRLRKLADQLLRRFDVDLQGLVVLTEAASGPYLPNPLLAALANAEVIAYVKDSRFGAASQIRKDTLELAHAWGVGSRLHVTQELDPEFVRRADIVTNSGHLRPIDSRFLRRLKPTAVVPLMWETWEFRGHEVDLQEAKKLGILVLGTREDRPPCDMRPYSPLFALKLLFEMGQVVYENSLLVVGSQPTLAEPIALALRSLGARVTWCGDHPRADIRLSELSGCYGSSAWDAVLVCEHAYQSWIIGTDGLLTPDAVARTNPAPKIGVITGKVDAQALRSRGVTVFPAHVNVDGTMSFQASELGPQPVMELFCAGLRVGRDMARARIAGLAPVDAAREALRRGPAMDFIGDDAWVRTR